RLRGRSLFGAAKARPHCHGIKLLSRGRRRPRRLAGQLKIFAIFAQPEATWPSPPRIRNSEGQTPTLDSMAAHNSGELCASCGSGQCRAPHFPEHRHFCRVEPVASYARTMATVVEKQSKRWTYD